MRMWSEIAAETIDDLQGKIDELENELKVANMEIERLKPTIPLPASPLPAPDGRRSPGHPTGYMIWDDGKLMQQFEYELSKWYGYWHTTRETEWLEVPTKRASNETGQARRESPKA